MGRPGRRLAPYLRLLAGALLAGRALAAGAALAQPREAVLAQTASCTERLDATYYDPSLVGEPMANGQPYDPRNPRLASSNRHRLGTLLLLRRADNARSVVVEVMDRGSADLGLDLSEAAFQQLAPLREGRVAVCVEVIR